MKTINEMCIAAGVTRNAMHKRLIRAKIKPVTIIKRTKYYSEEDYERMISYIPKSIKENEMKDRDYYRVSIQEFDCTGKYIWKMRAFGLSLKEAEKVARQYKAQGIPAHIIKCIFKK